MDFSKIFFILISFVYSCNGAGNCPSTPSTRPVGKLREKLFCNYDKHSLPVKNASEAVQVQLDVVLLSVDLSGWSETADIDAVFRFMWVDSFLNWDPTEYEEVQYIKLFDDETWEPDLCLNVLTGTGLQKVPASDCVLLFTGMISCAPQLSLKTPCIQDMRHWPYDKHNCSFSISSFLYYSSELNISDGKFAYRGPGKKSRFWDYSELSAVRHEMKFHWANITYPRIEYALLMTRHAASYAAGTVLPVFLMLGLVLSSFWLGTMVSCRVIINGFVMLGCITFLTYLMYLVPQNGDVVPIIVTLYRDCMALSTFGIIMATFVKLFSNSTLKPPLWLLSISDWLEMSVAGRLLCLVEVGPVQEDETTIVEAATTAKPNPWQPIVLLFDRISFLISVLIFFILLVGYIP